MDDDGTDLSEFLVPSESPVGTKRSAGNSDGSSSDEGDRDGGGQERRSHGPAAAPLLAPRKPQVIFCSRTHSQLSQFVGEVHRTRFAESLKLVAVASRRALCINEQVGWTAYGVGETPLWYGRT